MGKLLVSCLRDRYLGRPAVVLGSGSTLPDDLRHVPKGAVQICVNVKPAQLARPDYVVFLDDNVGEACTRLGVPRVSSLERWSDFDLTAGAWTGGFSASLATWLACLMGCAPVLLAGMGCYREEKHYFDDTPNDEEQGRYPLHFHLRAWAPAVVRCPNPHHIRAVSGPLTALFGAWPQEWTP